jgi:hypothetical protein
MEAARRVRQPGAPGALRHPNTRPHIRLEPSALCEATQLRHLALEAQQLLGRVAGLRSLSQAPAAASAAWQADALGAVVQLAQLTALTLHSTGWDQAAVALRQLQRLELVGLVLAGALKGAKLMPRPDADTGPGGMAAPAAAGARAPAAAAAAGRLEQLLPGLLLLNAKPCRQATELLRQQQGHWQLRDLRLCDAWHSSLQTRVLQLQLQELATRQAQTRQALQHLDALQQEEEEPCAELVQQLLPHLVLGVREEQRQLVLPEEEPGALLGQQRLALRAPAGHLPPAAAPEAAACSIMHQCSGGSSRPA